MIKSLAWYSYRLKLFFPQNIKSIAILSFGLSVARKSHDAIFISRCSLGKFEIVPILGILKFHGTLFFGLLLNILCWTLSGNIFQFWEIKFDYFDYFNNNLIISTPLVFQFSFSGIPDIRHIRLVFQFSFLLPCPFLGLLEQTYLTLFSKCFTEYFLF